MNLRDKISRWMYNRYGFDKLSYVLFIVYGALVLINIFIRSELMNFVMVLIIVYILFRLMSKNTTKRRMENDHFIKYLNRMKGLLQLNKRRIVEMKTYRFRRCPNCKTGLRLKRIIGTHKVECPRCHRELSVRIRF
jgi:uncharacterized paraquat-inducible protein A